MICVLNYAMCLAYNRSYPFKATLGSNTWLMGLSVLVFLIVFIMLFSETIEDNFLGRFFIRHFYIADFKIDLRFYVVSFMVI